MKSTIEVLTKKGLPAIARRATSSAFIARRQELGRDRLLRKNRTIPILTCSRSSTRTKAGSTSPGSRTHRARRLRRVGASRSLESDTAGQSAGGADSGPQATADRCQSLDEQAASESYSPSPNATRETVTANGRPTDLPLPRHARLLSASASAEELRARISARSSGRTRRRTPDSPRPSALEAAKESDARLRKGEARPLEGIPLGIRICSPPRAFVPRPARTFSTASRRPIN